MTPARPTDHSIPATLDEVLRWTEADHARPGTPAAKTVRLLVALLRLEAGTRADTLKRLHEATVGAGGGPESPAWGALVAALGELMQRANYREISGAELQEAFESQALSAVRIEVDMEAFSAMHIHARGKERRSEVIVSLFGLRRRRVDFDVLDRVFVLTCMNDAPAQDARVKGHGGADIRPVRLNLKLFRGIPVPDMEMLLPNTRLRMRRIDQAVVFVPAAISIGLAASKVLFSITAIIGLVKFWIGLQQEHPVASGGWGLVAAGSFTLLGITMGAWTKYQKRRLEYANAHSNTLYFQTLDSEAGAFLRVIDEAFEEEAKESVLAWAFLHAHGPASERALDERIERWIHERTGRHCDFEVDDALAKLARLGLAARAGETWTATAPDAAAAGLRARWDAAAG
ncbi:MAG: DUF3754 domain-containing protein [Phycisphaerales bacterium]|nr:DUF3754 domain-containing protein [Phycisphaerales bacterium]